MLIEDKLDLAGLSGIIRPEDFSDDHAHQMFLAIREIESRGQQATALSLIQELVNRRQFTPSVKTLNDYIFNAMDLFTIETPEAVAGAIRDHTTRVKLSYRLDALQGLLKGNAMPPLQDLVEQLQAAVDDTAWRMSNDAEIINMAEQMDTLDDRMEERAKAKNTVHIPTFLPKLTRMLKGGYRPGEVVTVAARTGVGKTFFATNTCALAGMLGKRVLMISLEMTYEELESRIVAALAKIPIDKIDGNSLSLGERLRFERAKHLIKTRFNVHVINVSKESRETRFTPSFIRAKVEEITRTKGEIDMVIIDYLQLLSANERSASEQENIASISRSTKIMAMQYNFVVMQLAQFNIDRDKDADSNREPALKDIRGSNAIAQDSNIIISIHRFEGSDGDGEFNRAGKTMMRVLKYRGGSSGGAVYCHTLLACGLFTEVTRHEELEMSPDAKVRAVSELLSGDGQNQIADLPVDHPEVQGFIPGEGYLSDEDMRKFLEQATQQVDTVQSTETPVYEVDFGIAPELANQVTPMVQQYAQTPMPVQDSQQGYTQSGYVTNQVASQQVVESSPPLQPQVQPTPSTDSYPSPMDFLQPVGGPGNTYMQYGYQQVNWGNQSHYPNSSPS